MAPRRERRTHAAMAMLGIATMVTSCSGLGSPEPTPSTTSGLPDCGTVDPHRPSPDIRAEFPADVIDCLVSGRRSGGAEFSLIRHTTEGDPIFYHLTVQEDSMEVGLLIDGSRDSFGDGSTERRTCSVPELSPQALYDCTTMRP